MPPPQNPYYAGGNSGGSGAADNIGPSGGYRDRYASGGIDWNRSERDYGDYRRDYDRRPPPPANS